MKISILYFAGFALIAANLSAQVGVNTETPRTTMDVSAKRNTSGAITDNNQLIGLQAPRLTRLELSNNTATYAANQQGALIYITDISGGDTLGQRTNINAVGYYYFDGTLWQKVSGNTVSVEPWKIVGTTNEATDNTQNIYQNGNVGIGDFSFNYPVNTKFVTNGAAVRLGLLNQGDTFAPNIGGNPIGDYSGTMGQANIATRTGAIALGYFTKAIGMASFTAGGLTKVSSDYETAIGYNNAITSVDEYLNDNVGGWTVTDPLLQIGNGYNNRNNALTILKNAHTAIGVDGQNASALPTELLDLGGSPTAGNGGLKIRNINSPDYVGNVATDKVVVADASGVLKTVNPSAFATAPVNIYNSDGTVTGSSSLRQVTLNGKSVRFVGNTQYTSIEGDGILSIVNTQATAGTPSTVGIYGGNNTNFFLTQFRDGDAQISANNNSKGMVIGTNATAASAPFRIVTSLGGGASGTEKLRVTGEGNVAINTISPTEKFDNNGITRLRSLPLNGATNAINTTSTGAGSATQNQTFTATRTVVADANGVLGYVSDIPSSAGATKVVVSALASGTQNIGNSNQLLADYPTESIDTNNAYSGNIFTVPAGMGGLYSFSMQSAHQHDVNSQVSWAVLSRLQKSTNGGTTYSDLMIDTNANLTGSSVDNGNAINWTGNLNAGDKMRLVYSSDSTASNFVRLGTITITKIAQ